VQIPATLLRADGGTLTVHGSDLATRPDRVRAAISRTGQFDAVGDVLTGREDLVPVAEPLHLADAGRTTDDLLPRSGLGAGWGPPPAGCAAAGHRDGLVGDPPVLVLDEPTT